MVYILWHEDGTGEDIRTEKPLTLKEMQGYVGGFIEMMRRTDDLNWHTLVVNEDGLALGLPVNQKFPFLVGPVIEGQMIKGQDGLEFVGF